MDSSIITILIFNSQIPLNHFYKTVLKFLTSVEFEKTTQSGGRYVLNI